VLLLINRWYEHFIIQMKNDQLSIDSTKLNSELQPEVLYKRGANAARTITHYLSHLTHRTLLSVQKKATWPALSSSVELLFKPHSLPMLLYRISGFNSPFTFAPSMVNESKHILSIAWYVPTWLVETLHTYNTCLCYN